MRMKIKSVKVKSGIIGWQAKLQDVYETYEEFEHYSGLFDLTKRLGYKSAKTAWQKNPTIQGSVNPSDYCKIAH